ncbi:MAG: PadR family transcriptional regulator [Candidatus Aenigmarchaeota archaeon]|nr:PadR family transcriptional regulator [Candidatus Aenigmarchaeota archaeon]
MNMKSEESFLTNMTKFYVITMLSEKPAHGYQIITRLRGITGKNISAGQIYPLLKELERKRLVRTQPIKDGKRKRNVYSLTAEGKTFSSGLLARFSELVDAAIKPRLTVCAHCGCNVYKGGFGKVVKGRRKMFCCRYCAGHY